MKYHDEGGTVRETSWDKYFANMKHEINFDRQEEFIRAQAKSLSMTVKELMKAIDPFAETHHKLNPFKQAKAAFEDWVAHV